MSLESSLPYLICYLVTGLYITLCMIWQAVRSEDPVENFVQFTISILCHWVFWPVTVYWLVEDVLGD